MNLSNLRGTTTRHEGSAQFRGVLPDFPAAADGSSDDRGRV
jgi:hypothetical protein